MCSGRAKAEPYKTGFSSHRVSHPGQADTGAALNTYTWPRGKDGNAVRSLAIAPDLRTFARGCFDATVRLYDASTGAEQRRIAVGEIPLAIRFSPDGKSIYVAAYEKPGV